MSHPPGRAAKHEPANTGIPRVKTRSPNKTVIPPKPGISPTVIYGQEVLYAARGQEARSRPAKARLHGCTPTGM